ncbi:MAG: transketolase [Gammaproteobacteria bacterium]|jgi:transketolase|nr:transketolase [Gammaproteobacteria bacterium]
MTATVQTNRSAAERRHLANAVRALAMDAVEQARSGHPGMPMGMADIAEVLWNDFLRHNPANPAWPDRDRFVLSNGHGSMLLYAVLHLSGYALSIDELRRFRQLGAHTAGHPERELHLGIETTTGPLGQGVANAVGMALAEKLLAAEFNRPGYPVVDHHTYVFLGDGCLMEGVSHEACSLAGTLGLGKLICLYDDNGISIDGHVQAWFGDDTPGRFEAYGWQVIRGIDGHDPAAIRTAIETARADAGRPTLICCKTIIGFGAPNRQGTEKVHGEALGADEVAAARKNLGWEFPPFEIPAAVSAAWDARPAGARLEQEWRDLFAAYGREYPGLAAEFTRRMAGKLPDSWPAHAAAAITKIAGETAAKATRKSSEDALNAFAPGLPEFFGGSADLTGSNLTRTKTAVTIKPGQVAGNYISWGVREFGMAAAMNGIALHGGLLPFGGTFLTFSDYSRNALRMAALMEIRVIHVFTHDSIGLGEDGPTHQPVEHTASLRLIPNMCVWRPCDAVETAVAWQDAIERDTGPTSLVLTRQALPAQPRTAAQLAAIRRGAYVLRDAGNIDLILIATGSEVQLALAAADLLAARGYGVRVVSMPSTTVFAAQDASYRELVLPAAVSRRVAIEAGVSEGWYRWVGTAGRICGLDSFGKSAPAPELFRHYGFTPEHVEQLALELLAN